MKKIKIQLLTVAIALITLFATPASAQNMSNLKNKTPQERAQMQTTLMKLKLNLDSAQLIKTQAINLTYALKMDAVLNGSEGKLRRLRDAKAIQKDKDADLKKVFTADQYKQYELAESELKEKLKDNIPTKN